MVVDEEIVKIKIEYGKTMFWLELITENNKFLDLQTKKDKGRLTDTCLLYTAPEDAAVYHSG